MTNKITPESKANNSSSVSNCEIMTKPDTKVLHGLVSELTEQVNRYLRSVEDEHSPPSTTGAPAKSNGTSNGLNGHAEPVRLDDGSSGWDVVRTCERIASLIHGPVPWLLTQALSHLESACLGAAMQLKLHDLISVGPDPTSLNNIAVETGVSKESLRRILRGCSQRFIFQEVATDQYAHTQVSALLRSTEIRSLAEFSCDEVMRSAACYPDYLEQVKGNPPTWNVPSPFSLAFDDRKSLFDFYSDVDEERGRRFGMAMSGSALLKPLIEDLFPFDSLPEGSTVVDVGGSRGHLSKRVSKKHPHLSFIAQDLPAVVKGISNTDKVTMMEHDIRNRNPVSGAEVYILRSILHDYPDAACVDILSNIAEVMDLAHSRILLDEMIVPDLLGQDTTRFMNQIDMTVAVTLNGKERSLKEWSQLVNIVPCGLRIEKIWRQRGSQEHWAVLELRLGSDGEETPE